MAVCRQDLSLWSPGASPGLSPAVLLLPCGLSCLALPACLVDQHPELPWWCTEPETSLHTRHWSSMAHSSNCVYYWGNSVRGWGPCHQIMVSCSWMDVRLKPRHSLNRSRSKSTGELGPSLSLLWDWSCPRPAERGSPVHWESFMAQGLEQVGAPQWATAFFVHQQSCSLLSRLL